MWALVAVLAPFLASEEKENQLFPSPIPYSATSIDYDNANAVSPFETQQIESVYYRHWLGTDQLGRDVLAQLLHGSKTALIIGIGVVLLAGFIGILLGGIAGYFGDDGFSIKRKQLITLTTLLPIYFVSITVLIPWEIKTSSGVYKFALLLFFSAVYTAVVLLAGRKSGKKSPLPIDLIVNKVIELIDSVPLLFILVCLSAIIKPSFFTTIVIIASVAWTSIAKYTRAEILKVKNENYIQSAKALALTNSHIIRKHILPNALGPVLVSLSFGLTAAILLEASLSFLGLGISSESASWGKLIASARNNYEAWWLAVFPGLAIFITLLASNKLSELFSKKVG